KRGYGNGSGKVLLLSGNDRGPLEIGYTLKVFAGFETPRQLQQLTFTHAEYQQIGLAVEEQGPSDLVLPVVIMGKPAQGGLDPADHDRYIPVCGLAAGGIDYGSPVRAGA